MFWNLGEMGQRRVEEVYLYQQLHFYGGVGTKANRAFGRITCYLISQ